MRAMPGDQRIQSFLSSLSRGEGPREGVIHLRHSGSEAR